MGRQLALTGAGVNAWGSPLVCWCWTGGGALRAGVEAGVVGGRDLVAGWMDTDGVFGSATPNTKKKKKEEDLTSESWKGGWSRVISPRQEMNEVNEGQAAEVRRAGATLGYHHSHNSNLLTGGRRRRRESPDTRKEEGASWYKEGVS